MRNSVTILALAYLGLVSSLPEPASRIDYSAFTDADTITRDVCVIGGGSSGTYAATRLRQLGKSVVVVEKDAIMGGHTNTYTVPSTGETIDYGVVVFHNTSVVRDYFAYYNVELGPLAFPSPNITYNVDLRTGKIVDGYVPPDPSSAFGRWAQQLEIYTYLVTGLNVPDPVPEDLLLPFRDFVAKHDLGDLAQTILVYAQGHADFMDQPTLYMIKLFGLDQVESLTTGYVSSAKMNNQALYDAAAAEYVAYFETLFSLLNNMS